MGGYRLRRFTEYNLEYGIFTWPASFGLTTGSSVDVGKFLRGVPPNTPFIARINGCIQFQGFTTNPGARGNKSGTTLKLQGRSLLERLRKGKPKKEKQFKNDTTEEIIRYAMADVGLSNVPLLTDSSASRKTQAGVNIFNMRGALPGTPPKQRDRHANTTRASS